MIKAIKEFDKLGESKFLSYYGVANSKSTWILTENGKYPAKAILRVAHSFVPGDKRVLEREDFYGGVKTKKFLEKLSFTVEHTQDIVTNSTQCSEKDL
ncbi:MAG: hypothetical protein RIC87_08300 [Kiloniellales bacterium]